MINTNSLNFDLLVVPTDVPAHSSLRLNKSILSMKTPSTFEEDEEDLEEEDQATVIEEKLQWIFVNTVKHLYQDALALDRIKGKEIFIGGTIETDGSGDYYHLVNDFEILHRAYPECPIKIIADVKDLKNRIKNFDIPEKCQVRFVDTSLEDFTTIEVKQALVELKKASVIIDAPYGTFPLISYPTDRMEKCWKEVSFSSPNPNKVLQFQEIDGELGGPLESNIWSLGLMEFHEGFFIKEPLKDASFANLKDKTLKKFLFNKELPTSEEILSYQQEHHCHYGYIKADNVDSITSAAFLLTIIAAHAESKKPIIDVMLPKANLKIESCMIKMLKKFNLSSIQLFKKENEQFVLQEEINMAQEGKILRIINPFPLANSDCNILTSLVEDPVGCTGDISLCETLRRLFYYQAAAHKQEILASILKVIKEDLPNQVKNPLVEYFEKLNDISNTLHEETAECNFNDLTWESYQQMPALPASKKPRLEKTEELLSQRDKKICESAIEIGLLLRNPQLVIEMASFTALLEKHYNFNEVLKALVARSFALQAFPALEESEKSLQKQFTEQEISLQVAYDQLKEKIKQIKST